MAITPGMGITSIKRDVLDPPSIIRIITTNSSAEVITPGYLLDQADNINNINKGVFQWAFNGTDIVAMVCSDIHAFFTVDLTTQAFVPLTEAGGDVTSVNGTTNRITVSPTTGDVVVDIAATYVGQTSITTLGTITTGTWNGTNIPLAYGGTNASLTAVANSVPYCTATAFALTAALTDGEVVIGSSAGAPVPATLTAGTGISITNAANSITIASTASGMAFSTVAGTTQAAQVDHGYIIGNAAQTTVTLPATAVIGSQVMVLGSTTGVAGWILAPNAGQTIQVGSQSTSTSVISSAATDNIWVICTVADTTWEMLTTNSASLTVS